MSFNIDEYVERCNSEPKEYGEGLIINEDLYGEPTLEK